MHTYIKYSYIFSGKKLYIGIGIGNVIDLLHLVLQGISMDVGF